MVKLTEKVKNTLKDVCKNYVDIDDIEDVDLLLVHYDNIIDTLGLWSLRSDKKDELNELERELSISLDRKYLYLLIEKVKNNLDDEPKANKLGEFIKDKDTDYLLGNIDELLREYELYDLEGSKCEEEELRMEYLNKLLDKKHLYLLLEHLESL